MRSTEVLSVEPLRVRTVDYSKPITFDEWANMDEDEPGEFVDGRLVDDEDSTVLHELVVAWLVCKLSSWGEPRKWPVFGSGLKFRVSETRGRKADVSMFPQGTRFRDAAFVAKPPMLIVEVVSKASRDVKRDRLEKLREYAKFGVQHYWLVDPEARVFEFLTLGPDGRWLEGTESASEGRVEVAGFDGLILNLDELWAEADSILEEGEDEPVEGDEF